MKNKRIFSQLYFLPLLVVASLIMSACGPGSGIAQGNDGTIIWLDQPMTNYDIPLAPFTLIAHADHPGGGISQVVFQVNGVSVGAVSTDTSTEFLRADLAWNPSAEGEYRIQAQAVTPGGGAYTRNAYVCVRAGITTPQPRSGLCDNSPSNLFSLSVNLRSFPLYRGLCPGNIFDIEITLAGDTRAVAAVQGSWGITNIDGTPPGPGANGEAMQNITHMSDTSYSYTRDLTNLGRDYGLGAGNYLLTGIVQAMDSSGHVLAAQTIGPITLLDCPATPTPSATPTPTATIPAPSVTPYVPTHIIPPPDTTPPSVSGISLNPADIVYSPTGCGANTLSVQANITDPSGIASATLVYQYSGGSNMSVGMSNSGGSAYQGTINVGGEAYGILLGVDGTLTVSVQATDLLGNTTTINGGSVAVKICPV